MPPYAIPLALVVAAAAAGCGQADSSNATPRLVARVDGKEISVLQTDPPGARANGAQAQPTAPQALERLIDHELLAAKARQAGLDRDPQVVRSLADEKRRMLGQAYLERTLPPAPKRSAEEIHAFYADNPALFAQRRIYRVRELQAAVPAERQEALRSVIGAANNLATLADWFKAQNIPFTEIVSTRPAEHLPLEVLLRIATMKTAQIAMFVAPDNVSALELAGAENAPLTEAQAAPLIEQLLTNRWRLELARQELKRLRELARIEYLGRIDGRSAGIAPRPPRSGHQLVDSHGERRTQRNCDDRPSPATPTT